MNFNRRTFLSLSAAGIIAPSLVNAETDITKKKISSTGEWIPAIGMGSWLTFDVGNNKQLRAQRTKVLKTFFELGGQLVDSSPMYGSSQSVIGDALSRIDNDEALFSADKVWTNSDTGGPGQITRTQKRWGVDKFDLLQVHNLVNWQTHLETLFEMKARGDLRYVGITSYAGLRYDDIEEIMTAHPIDFIQITYNLVDREAENRLFPLALEKGIAVIANRPFRQGSLIDAVSKTPLPGHAKEFGASNWAQYLLKYIISHPAITVAIPATRRVDHMQENMGALRGPLPDSKLRQKMSHAI